MQPMAARTSSAEHSWSTGREHKMLTAIDDHSRFVVAANRICRLPSGPAVCDAFLAAIARWGIPFEVLTDNGKQFTGKFTKAATGRGPSSSGSAASTASRPD